MIKPNLCDYSGAYILVTGNKTVVGGDDNTKVAFKNCAPFTKCKTRINDELLEESDNLHIIMPVYNLLEYSDNYSDSVGSLYQFKRDEPPSNNANITENTPSFKYKSDILDDLVADGDNRILKKCKNSSTVKIYKQFFPIIINAIN